MDSKTTTAPDTPSTSKVLADEITSLVNKTDIECALQLQKEIKGKLCQTTTTLTEFNERSEKELGEIGAQLEEYTRLNKEMKKDLEDIFKRLRAMKVDLLKKYPSEFRQANAELIEQFGELEDD